MTNESRDEFINLKTRKREDKLTENTCLAFF